jgi:hypothetical protein
LPRDEEILRAFLEGAPFVFVGPERWSPLGLGRTSLVAVPLAYNTKGPGTLAFARRPDTSGISGTPKAPSDLKHQGGPNPGLVR